MLSCWASALQLKTRRNSKVAEETEEEAEAVVIEVKVAVEEVAPRDRAASSSSPLAKVAEREVAL